MSTLRECEISRLYGVCTGVSSSSRGRTVGRSVGGASVVSSLIWPPRSPVGQISSLFCRHSRRTPSTLWPLSGPPMPRISETPAQPPCKYVGRTSSSCLPTVHSVHFTPFSSVHQSPSIHCRLINAFWQQQQQPPRWLSPDSLPLSLFGERIAVFSQRIHKTKRVAAMTDTLSKRLETLLLVSWTSRAMPGFK